MNSMRKNPTKLYTVELVVHSSSNLSQPLIRSLKKGMTFQHFPIQIYDENQWKTLRTLERKQAIWMLTLSDGTHSMLLRLQNFFLGMGFSPLGQVSGYLILLGSGLQVCSFFLGSTNFDFKSILGPFFLLKMHINLREISAFKTSD